MIRLLSLDQNDKIVFTEFEQNVPRYAILSHTWYANNAEELTYRDVVDGNGSDKIGYRKVRFCLTQANSDGMRYAWCDCCCIDKNSAAELSEAINSICLNDRSRQPFLEPLNLGTILDQEPWWSRAWTLQELLAPVVVQFYSAEGQYLTDKASLGPTVAEVTGIPNRALHGGDLSAFEIEERISWVQHRLSKKPEDKAYCLLGILDISMPVIYGEGQDKAFTRLRNELRVWDSKVDATPPKASITSHYFSGVDISSSVQNRASTLYNSLPFVHMEAQRLAVKPPHQQTCQWVLQNPKYLSWLNDADYDAHRGFLWIKGVPGSGKSTLMKFLIDELRGNAIFDVHLSTFFNIRGAKLEKTANGAYRTILMQILQQVPELQPILVLNKLAATAASTHNTWPTETLKALLFESLNKARDKRVVLLIDGLDECNEDEVRDMLNFFESFSDHVSSSSQRPRFCFSSRHYPHITIRQGLDLVLEDQSGHDEDIRNYLATELRIGDGKPAQKARIDLSEKASGVFAWVAAAVSTLNKEYDSGNTHALSQRLTETPASLSQLSRFELHRDIQNNRELVLCIQWLLFAQQPLTLQQLYFAIRAGSEDRLPSEIDIEHIKFEDMRRFVLNASRGLVRETGSKQPIMQFIHESVGRFYLKENKLRELDPALGGNLKGRSHERLKQCCLVALRHNTLALPRGSYAASFQRDQGHVLPRHTAAPFLHYAISYVFVHADNAAGYGIAQDAFLRDFNLTVWLETHNALVTKPESAFPPDARILYLLAWYNAPYLIRSHSSPLLCLQAGPETYVTPLHAALINRSDLAVRAFLECHKRQQGQRSALAHAMTSFPPIDCRPGDVANIRESIERSGADMWLSSLVTYLHTDLIYIILELNFAKGGALINAHDLQTAREHAQGRNDARLLKQLGSKRANSDSWLKPYARRGTGALSIRSRKSAQTVQSKRSSMFGDVQAVLPPDTEHDTNPNRSRRRSHWLHRAVKRAKDTSTGNL